MLIHLRKNFTRQFLLCLTGSLPCRATKYRSICAAPAARPETSRTAAGGRNEKRIYHLVSPMEIAREWVGRHRRGMVSDYDQAAFLIGACFDNSGINVVSTLNNSNFTPHPALGPLLEWLSRRGGTTEIRNAAIRARSILHGWTAQNQEQARQLEFFLDEETAS